MTFAKLFVISILLVMMTSIDPIATDLGNYVLTLPEDTDNINFEVPRGEEFAVIMKGNPSTGYGWFLVEPENLETSNLITPLNLDEYNSAEFMSDPLPAGFVGGGGSYVFKFRASENANNIENLTFEYKRPWEDTSFRTVNVTVKITKQK